MDSDLQRRLSVGTDPDIDDPRYTSLRDIILNSPPSQSAIQEGSEFDLSKITIRNELVKFAASAYLQSATILVPRNENYFAKYWWKLRNDAATSCSCWNVYFKEPLKACFHQIYRFVSYLGDVWNRIT
ncbi:hypothetical protein SLEP1_g6322 [Rubroshorea leprosula]|uniref:SWIM-type domain-containing protein n=1 Tax=Rubroshorea leprosula TaxID=152421 RepID=A0AAV5I0U9_9ROSI|nr:hypothetical protein SLEP1_g6322 [Rubroshorea leprosula]